MFLYGLFENGYLDGLPISLVTTFAAALQEYIMVKDKRFFDLVKASKKLDPDAEALLKEAIGKILDEMK